MFLDVSDARGIGRYVMAEGMGGGVAAADYDNDGDIDIFVPTGAGEPDQLYRNLGDGYYEEIASIVGVASLQKNRVALWFDYDGDHDLDLLVANDVEEAASGFLLYRQASDGLFEDVTKEAGLAVPSPVRVDATAISHRGGMCVGDINNDGFLDLYAVMWNGKPQLFVNNGDGTFSDRSSDSGVNTALHYAHQPVMADFDGDGWLDIYVAIDFLHNALYINQRDGTFVDVAPQAGLDNAMNDMGVTLGDADNDGDLDIYITNIFQFLAFNVLLRNDSALSTLKFSEVAESAGVDFGGWGWGTTFLDADNDGWLDIAATNGWFSAPHATDRSRFYRNRGGAQLRFDDVSSDVQFDDSYWGSALIAFDSDRDGDLDLLQTCHDGPLRLLENQAEQGPDISDRHFLVVKPRMDGPNHFAVGAVVRVRAGGLNMMRIINAGTSYLGQEPAEAFFGLGAAHRTDSVIVEWPDGSVTNLTSVAADTVLTVMHAGFGDVNADGVVDLDDYGLFAACMTGSSATVNSVDAAYCRPSDMNADGRVDLADFAILQRRLSAR